MLSLAEIGPALYGAWRLAHFDPSGMRYFDRSIDGFWRSFRVAVLAAPFTALLIALELSDRTITGGWFRVLAGEAIAYVIGWVAFPLIAFYLTVLIDRRDQYLGFIVVYNWSALIQLGLVLPATLVYHSALLPGAFGLAVIYAADIALLIYEWFIVRTSLNLPGFGAVGIVAIDVIVSLIVNYAGDAITQTS
jgi:hypothetical protein